MMKISKRKGKLNVTIEPECTIIDVEEDTDKIRSRMNDVTSIVVKADGVTEMDTAYFQLILSLMNTADELGIEFSIPKMSEEVKGLFDTYGVKRINSPPLGAVKMVSD